MQRTRYVMRVTDTPGESECPEASTGVRGRENNQRGWEGGSDVSRKGTWICHFRSGIWEQHKGSLGRNTGAPWPR